MHHDELKEDRCWKIDVTLIIIIIVYEDLSKHRCYID